MTAFGQKLKRIRSEKKLTLRQVEEIAGLSYSFIAALERGKFKPSRESIKQLATALDAPEDELLVSAGFVPSAGSFERDDLLNKMIQAYLIQLEDKDGRFSDEVAKDIFFLFEGLVEDANTSNFDKEFREYLQFHNGIIPKPTMGIFNDLTIDRLHIYYNRWSIQHLLLNNEDTAWKTGIRNKLAEIVAKQQAGKDLFSVELTDPDLDHKIFVDDIELSQKEIKKIIATIRLDRESE